MAVQFEPEFAIKDGNYRAGGYEMELEDEVEVFSLIDLYLRKAPLAGFVYEGHSPYGTASSAAHQWGQTRLILY